MWLKDRVPTYPNRKKIKFLDDGTERMAIIEYADEATEEGTPITALTLDSLVPKGIIMMWSGNENDIPDGWALCDGTNGTPDLRNRFVIGAGGKYDAGEIGGNETIDISHSHSYSGTVKPTGSSVTEYVGTGAGRSFVAQNHTHDYSGNTSQYKKTIDNLPPYYALCYIMKLTQISAQAE